MVCSLVKGQQGVVELKKNEPSSRDATLRLTADLKLLSMALSDFLPTAVVAAEAAAAASLAAAPTASMPAASAEMQEADAPLGSSGDSAAMQP